MSKNLDPAVVQLEISNLLLQYPELAEDEILRADMIEAETLAFDFLSEIVRKIGSSSALAQGTADYMKELGERKARVERRVDALRALAFKIMTVADIRKAELPEATLSVRAGTPKVIITDETLLPADCIRQNPTPDKTKIKELLSQGPVAGAALSNGDDTLSIRIK